MTFFLDLLVVVGMVLGGILVCLAILPPLFILAYKWTAWLAYKILYK